MAAKDINFRQYGAGTSIWFAALAAAGAVPYAAGYVAGECRISKDGGAFVNTTNLPTYLSGGIYDLVLTAAEMQATHINLWFYTAAAQAAYAQIDTKLSVSRIFVGADTLPLNVAGLEIRGGGGGGEAVILDAVAGNSNGVSIYSNGTAAALAILGDSGLGLSIESTSGTAAQLRAISGNSVGLSLVGSGVGSGLQATGGATNAPGIVAIGQAAGAGFQGISGSAGPSNFFSELIEDIIGVPTPGATTVRQGISALLARFFNRVTQTTTQQIVYSSDSVTPRVTAAVSDDNVTQVKNRAT